MTETTVNDSYRAEKASFATLKPTAPDSHTPHLNAETTHGISSSLEKLLNSSLRLGINASLSTYK
ncbi:uncharacterized protein RAG0_13963 [Rhynchosporium agropyri]|uniref:Uncharacterized protein n=1 Tax=Rhynchosporium agropyri TaxID=914238 RepID=A0A1E1LF05_9HELO|nr:uncharacterized protein RAG0_13963 [Rhynchosporium agropyri]